jgi:sugar phosphate isomerase/epimerase
MKRLVVSLAVLMLCLGTLASAVDAGEKVVLPRYPDLKVGFTTWNFSKQMPVNLANAKKWVDFAAEQGFAWMELRDPGAVLTLAECKEIAVYAKQRDVEIIYAVMAGLLDPNFWEVYSRAVANANVFDGPRIVRTALPGLEYAANEKKTAWTLAEFSKIVETANQAANMARMFGLRYMVENATETLKGDGVTSFGTTEFFANVNSNVGLQLDTANFFVTSRVPAKAEDARGFLEKTAGKMGYVHVKTATNDNKPAPVLGENPRLIFEIVFWSASKNKAPYLAIELPQPNTLEELYANTKKSVEYLVQNF